MDKFAKKSIVFSIMMLGQISYNPTDNYYEDDPDFNSVSTQLLIGWSWGFNKAHADCNDSSAEPDCITVGPSPGFDIPNLANVISNVSYPNYDDYSDDFYQGPNWDEYVNSSHFLMCEEKASKKPFNCFNFHGDPYDRIRPNGCSTLLNVPFWNDYFNNSCNSHDTCYSTLGVNRSACDLNFKTDMQTQCLRERNIGIKMHCYNAVHTLYEGVSYGGWPFYILAQSKRKCADWIYDMREAGCVR